MNKVCFLPFLLVVAAPLAAQKDSITLRDGTVLRNVKVTDWTAKEIKFQSDSGNDVRPSHLVQKATIEKVQEALSRAGNTAEGLVGEADAQKKDALIASSCLYSAAMLFYDAGEANSMFSALQRIDQEFPESPYAPEYYRWKIKYYVKTNKPKDAAKIAQQYGDASRTRTWSAAYQLDSEYWERRLGSRPDNFVSNMREIIGKSSDNAPFVAQAAAADVADAFRAQKKYDEAKAEYNKLQDQKGLSADVRARMYLGLGYIALESAVNSKNKSDYHEAFKNFLRVFLNAKTADPELVAEGLYNAAKACEAWGELPSCGVMAGRLRGRLKFREPWKSTSWANKK